VATYLRPDRNDKALTLIVTGPPATHHNYIWTPGWPRIFRYPYRFALSGAKPAGQSPGYNSLKDVYPGKNHPNGGGWVANTANVASTAYVGPYAQVLDNATVSGNARIDGHAIIKGSPPSVATPLSGVTPSWVFGQGEGKRCCGASSQGFSITATSLETPESGSPIGVFQFRFRLSHIKDLAWLNGATVSGTAIIGGDAEDYRNHFGRYIPPGLRVRNGDGLSNHYLNNDINPTIDEYTSLKPVNATIEGFDYSVDKTNRACTCAAGSQRLSPATTLAGQHWSVSRWK
jgi:hypothetical protein